MGGFFMGKKKIMNITILRPGGNDTALISGIPSRGKMKEINDTVMKKYPNVEQVGFYTFDSEKKLARLEMAGGEFCGNATRSLAYLLLGGDQGEVKITVSGTSKVLLAGSKKKNTAYAQMPIYPSFASVEKVEKTVIKVKLEGIIHLITQSSPYTTEEVLKNQAKQLLKKYDLLLSTPAAGVMFINESENNINCSPVVWVRDIKTFFYETACATGATAIGLMKALNNDQKKIVLSITQPSKETISIKVEKTRRKFKNAWIDGDIQILFQGEFL